MGLWVLDLCTYRQKETWLHFYNVCGLKQEKPPVGMKVVRT